MFRLLSFVFAALLTLGAIVALQGRAEAAKSASIQDRATKCMLTCDLGFDDDDLNFGDHDDGVAPPITAVLPATHPVASDDRARLQPACVPLPDLRASTLVGTIVLLI
jgi:hypothetical protein